MSTSVQLLAACDSGDEAAIELLGWRPVVDALRAFRGRVDGEALAPIAAVLGDEDPAEVAAAIRALLRARPEHHYRPSASEIYAELHPPAPAVTVGARPRAPRPDQALGVDAAVRAAAVTEPVCEFPCPAGPYGRSPQWTVDAAGVLRCAQCGGLEIGQYEQATEIDEASA